MTGAPTAFQGSGRWWDALAAALVALALASASVGAWTAVPFALVGAAVPWTIARRAGRTRCTVDPAVGVTFEHPPLVRWRRPARRTLLPTGSYWVVGRGASAFTDVIAVRLAPDAGVDRVPISLFRSKDRRRIAAWVEELQAEGPLGQ